MNFGDGDKRKKGRDGRYGWKDGEGWVTNGVAGSRHSESPKDLGNMDGWIWRK